MHEETQAFIAGCLITILAATVGWTTYSTGSVRVDEAVEVAAPAQREAQVIRCSREHPVVPDRYWDDELEVYLPPNYGWWECMGVGRK